jgi:hypothetical protein
MVLNLNLPMHESQGRRFCRPDTVLCLLLLLLPATLAVYFGFHPPDGKGHPADFAVYRTAAEIVRFGPRDQLYDLQTQRDVFFRVTKNKFPVLLVWVHHPAEALLYLPTTFFDYETGLFLMRLFNAGILFILVIWTAIKIGPNSDRLFLLWLVLMMSVRSFVYAMQAGQDSIWILFLIVWGLVAASENRSRLSGGLLGLASLKFTIVLPLIAILLVSRFYRIAGYSLIVAFLLILLPCLVLGLGILHAYFILCTALLSMNGQLGLYPALLRNFRGILYRWAPRLFPHTIAVSAVLGSLYAISCRKLSANLVLPIALLGATFFSPHLFPHDTVMYVGAFIVLLITSRPGHALNRSFVVS